MELSTYSDGFRAQLGERERVVAAVFTTYSFEPEFFEQEIIPLMLDQSLAFSSDQRIKSIQVREALSQAGLPIEVFYDLDLFRQQGTVSPSMEYLHHGIRGERSAFHAKLVLLLLEDEDSKERSLYVGAGSANLTIAGWWENIECQHWERVTSGEVNRRFLNQLRDDLAWLAARRRSNPENNHQGNSEVAGHALALIAAFLDPCRSSNSAAPISYYGLTSLSLGQQRRPAFMRFLRDAIAEQSPHYKRWGLEIISPYFAESPGFDGHEHFFNDLGVEEIHVFLPINDQGEALCNPTYYERLAQTDRVTWASWSPEVTKSLGVQTPVNRTTHAKIYHLYNGMQSWVFVGSVNFTHRATSDNQEAGFFTQLPVQTRLLKPLRSAPEKWCPENQLPGAAEGKSEGVELPDLLLIYDWKTRQLSAALGERHGKRRLLCQIHSPEGAVQVADIAAGCNPNHVVCDADVIEGLLKNTGFLRVSGTWRPSGDTFPAFEVLVQQLNWTHKPLNLPHLSPQEIMQIYTGLNPVRRNQVIEFLKLRQLREMGLLGESAGSQGHEDTGRQFFAEYAELFHAFRNLRLRLDECWMTERAALVDYYLSGRGMDSLPTLFESLHEDGRNLEPVTIYLALLCLIQIYECPDYRGRPQAEHWLGRCWQEIEILENSGELRLIDDDLKRTRNFFSWYRTQFFREYRTVTGEDDHETD